MRNIYLTDRGKATLSKSSILLGEKDIQIQSGNIFEYRDSKRAYVYTADDLQDFARQSFDLDKKINETKGIIY